MCPDHVYGRACSHNGAMGLSYKTAEILRSLRQKQLHNLFIFTDEDSQSKQRQQFPVTHTSKINNWHLVMVAQSIARALGSAQP